MMSAPEAVRTADASAGAWQLRLLPGHGEPRRELRLPVCRRGDSLPPAAHASMVRLCAWLDYECAATCFKELRGELLLALWFGSLCC